VRLLAWNCCSGPLSNKLAAVEELRPDLAVLPECPKLAEEPGRILWFGANRHKGLAIIARPPWRIDPAPLSRRLPRWVRPVRVEGPCPFLLWAVWACGDRPHRYVRGIHRTLDLRKHMLVDRPNVLLGDFNSHSLWDPQYPRDRNHSALVRRLGALGLVSSYHAFYAEAHGLESRPTFFEYRHRHRPYHIDYCFFPASWLPRLESVTLGEHAAWARRSDHMPLLTTFSAAAD
jgi:endonuclease/exonuclease/phosphatase family protein